MKLISKQDIQEVFSMKEAIEADKEAFRLFSLGESKSPLRTSISAPEEEGTFLFMPAYARDIQAAAIKIVNVFPKNIVQAKSSTSATVILIDGKTGETLALLDGTYLTQLRTGASTGVAFDLLAKKDCRKGAIIGAGGQATTQLEAMLTVGHLDEVMIYDQNQQRLADFVQKMKTNLVNPFQTVIRAVGSADDAVRDADLLVTATVSKNPVFNGKLIKKGATVSCVGSYQPDMQEMDPALLTRADKIYFDAADAVLAESGDILIPLNEGKIKKTDFTGNIGDLLLERIKAREDDDEIIVYETVGLAILDLVMAKRIYDKILEAGLGLEWNL